MEVTRVDAALHNALLIPVRQHPAAQLTSNHQHRHVSTHGAHGRENSIEHAAAVYLIRNNGQVELPSQAEYDEDWTMISIAAQFFHRKEREKISYLATATTSAKCSAE